MSSQAGFVLLRHNGEQLYDEYSILKMICREFEIILVDDATKDITSIHIDTTQLDYIENIAQYIAERGIILSTDVEDSLDKCVNELINDYFHPDMDDENVETCGNRIVCNNFYDDISVEFDEYGRSQITHTDMDSVNIDPAIDGICPNMITLIYFYNGEWASENVIDIEQMDNAREWIRGLIVQGRIHAVGFSAGRH
jgi:hypothetical protein